MNTEHNNLHRIVIVGGGAGGLELATRLGDRLGKRGRAHVTLIERRARISGSRTCTRSPPAASTSTPIATDYLAQSHWHGFRYRIGEMIGLDRTRREVQVAPYIDDDGDAGHRRARVPYDTLVIAIGSLTNDFGTPGVQEHAIPLETPRAGRALPSPPGQRLHPRPRAARAARPEQFRWPSSAPAPRAWSWPPSCTRTTRPWCPTVWTGSIRSATSGST